MNIARQRTGMITRNSSQNPLPALLAKFPGGADVGLLATETLLYLAQDIGSGLYWCPLLAGTYANGANAPTLDDIDFRRAGLTKAEGDASITFSGTWTDAGPYRRTSTTNDYVQFVTPAGVSWLGIFGVAAPNSGIHLVTIDGDATLAGLLPTAQDLVTAGTLASTALVANGGTLNPTDRVLDQTDGNNSFWMFADDLTAGVHTVRITNTGYKRAANTDDRLYFASYWYGGDGIATIRTPNAYLARREVLALASRYEFAHSTKPTGATLPEWIGHEGSLKQTSLTFTVDGSPVTPVDGNVYGGSESVVVTLAAGARHSEIGAGATDIASVTTVYTMRPTSGLEVSSVINWLVDALIDSGYPAMYPLVESFNKGATLISTQDYALTTNNDSIVVNEQTNAAYVWQTSGNYGALLYIPDVLEATDNWAHANGTYLWIQDRAGGTLNKIYLTRSSPETIQTNDVWNATVQYRMHYFAGGANAALAR